MDEKIERRRSLPISELIHCRGTDVERSHTPEGRARAARPSGDPPDPYGVVVDSVNVSVLLYEPVRSASVDLTSWLYSIVTASLDTGAFHVSRFSGEADEPTLLYAVPVLAALRARACSGWARTNVPLTRWPVPSELGSATLSVASPAVEMTVAVVDARYGFVMPGVKTPNCTGAPSVSDSVAPTLPPTVPLTGTRRLTTTLKVLTCETLPFASLARQLTTVVPIANLEPDSGRHVTAGFGSSLSVAVGFVNVTAVPVGSVV